MNGEKVKVSITLNKVEGRYQVVSSHPLPPSNVIPGFLPKAKKSTGQRYCCQYGFPGVIGAAIPTITPKDWCEAIAKATLFLLDAANGADVELVSASEGGYLSIGNFVFKLSVADYVVGGQRALPVLRKRVLDSARREGQSIIEAAQQKGLAIYNGAEKKYMAKLGEVEKLQQQVRDMQRGMRISLPPWFADSGLLFRADSRTSYIGAWIGVSLHAFIYTSPDGARHIWHGTPAPDVPLLLWFPYDVTGEWNPERLQTSESTPHTSTIGSCLKLGTTPKLTSAEVVLNAANHVEQVLQEVNINSPYCSYRSWGRFQAFVPEKLKATLIEWDKTGARLPGLCERIKGTADEAIPPPLSQGTQTVFGVPAEFTTGEDV